MVDKKDRSIFPEDFLWGASTSSHQVEGGNYNQWTVWELENAARLAKTAEQRYSWLPRWKEIRAEAEDPNNYVSGTGMEHYERYEHDFDLAKALNFNAFRFSIEWSRLEPEEGKWDAREFRHYREYIRAMKKRGLEPMLNLWHWTNPVWFEERGGFMRYGNIGYFLRFCAKVIEELGDEVKYVIILNEPNIYTWFSFFEGKWPAPYSSPLEFVRSYTHLLLAHRRAYKIIKSIKPELQVSSAPQLVINVPRDESNLLHRIGAWTANFGNNGLWLMLTRKHVDFIGFNNYFKNYVKGIGTSNFANPKTPVNDLGWYMEPEAVGEVIMMIHKKYPGVPIMVTENGVADGRDKHRKWWIEKTIASLEDAIKEGANVKGYLYWSLLDNFEWAEGWWPKFGLVEVDRKTMKRRVRDSAKWFAKEIAARRQDKD